MKVKSVFFTWRGQCDYLTPSVTVLDYQSEGLLCISSEFNLGGGGSYTDDDINDNGSY
jgi:hypothetical protein